MPASPDLLLNLQRSAGNQSVVHLLSTSVIQRSPAEDLIDKHTKFPRRLQEDDLGQDLLARALRSEFDIIWDVFNELDWSDEDDVALEMAKAASPKDLMTIAGSFVGRRLLDKLYDHLTEGSMASDEEEQANRILQVKAQQINAGDAEKAMLGGGKVFPFRSSGITVLDDAPVMAERRSGGRIWVKQPHRVSGTDMFRGETDKLPRDVFLGGIELPENEVIGVKFYDLGGEVVYRPALFLIQVSNQNDTATITKIAEIAGIGLTLGTGALAGLGVEASMTARVLLWADRAAFAIGTVAMVVKEHRGWIISRFGDDGRRFLRYVDIAQSATAMYGFARVALGMGRVMWGLRESYANWKIRAAAAEDDLNMIQKVVVKKIGSETDDLLQQADQIDGARPSQPAGGGQGGQPSTTPAPGGGKTTTPAPTKPGSSTGPREITTLTNVEPEIPAPEVLNQYVPGSGFSGAYNSKTGGWRAVASGDAKLLSGKPVATVPQYGGHAAAEAALMAKSPGLNPADNVGFVLVWKGNNTVQIRWNSGTINGRNFGDAAAPAKFRDAIKAVVAKTTGATVVE